MGMTLNALLVASDESTDQIPGMETLIELEKDRRLYVLLFDMLMDSRTRRWLDSSLEKNWESL